MYCLQNNTNNVCCSSVNLHNFFKKIEISYVLYIKLTMLQERVSMIVI